MEYSRKVKVMLGLIKNVYPDLNFDIVLTDLSLIRLILNVDDKSGSVVILPDNDWSELKRHIDSKIMELKNPSKECDICMDTITKTVSCNKCANRYCTECYIKLFESGKGIIICPFCRSKVGFKHNKTELSLGVRTIRYKLSRI